MSDIHLHLLRHAHAGDPLKWTRPDDERPLSARGTRQADRLGRLLAARAFAPDAIVTSPSLRAEQTARIVAEALGRPVRVDDRLASGFGMHELTALLDELGWPTDPVLVGHDPDFSELLSELVGAPIGLRKGALARVDIREPIAPGDGALRWLLPPDALAEER